MTKQEEKEKFLTREELEALPTKEIIEAFDKIGNIDFRKLTSKGNLLFYPDKIDLNGMKAKDLLKTLNDHPDAVFYVSAQGGDSWGGSVTYIRTSCDLILNTYESCREKIIDKYLEIAKDRMYWQKIFEDAKIKKLLKPLRKKKFIKE